MTDKDCRAEFEAVASDNGKWPQAVERDAKGDYILMQTAIGWVWWKAARRAPAVHIDQAVMDVMHLIADWSEKEWVASEARFDPWYEHDPAAPMQILETLDKEAHAASLAIEQKLRVLLAAAPQTPEATVNHSLTVDSKEAAPVQLPEPRIYWIEATTKFCIKRGGDVPFASAWEPLYTEQQVRQILSTLQK